MLTAQMEGVRVEFREQAGWWSDIMRELGGKMMSKAKKTGIEISNVEAEQ